MKIGGAVYEISVTRKEMRSIRLRVLPGGALCLSVPFGVERETAEAFLRERAQWIAENVEQMERKAALVKRPPLSEAERRRALARLQPVVDRLYPIVEAYGVARPHVTVRAMRTRFGSCSVNRGRITLNAMLADAPEAAVEYVVLHELAHFLHPNHSRAFYGFIERYMPDWRERERILKGFDA